MERGPRHDVQPGARRMCVAKCDLRFAHKHKHDRSWCYATDGERNQSAKTPEMLDSIQMPWHAHVRHPVMHCDLQTGTVSSLADASEADALRVDWYSVFLGCLLNGRLGKKTLVFGPTPGGQDHFLHMNPARPKPLRKDGLFFLASLSFLFFQADCYARCKINTPNFALPSVDIQTIPPFFFQQCRLVAARLASSACRIVPRIAPKLAQSREMPMDVSRRKRQDAFAWPWLPRIPVVSKQGHYSQTVPPSPPPIRHCRFRKYTMSDRCMPPNVLHYTGATKGKWIDGSGSALRVGSNAHKTRHAHGWSLM